jgi:aryl-alcohol dehydrogenase-like predicted oxidoreductase
MTLRPEPYTHLVSPAVFEGLTRLESAAANRGVDMTAIAIAWVLQHPCVDAAIIGPRSPRHLDAALAGVEVRLSDQEAQYLAAFFPA